MRTSIMVLTIGLLASPALAAGGHMGGMPGGMSGLHPTMSGPSTVSHSAMPTNPNTRSGKAIGQPSQTCQNAPNYPANTPGGAFNAPGSAFNPNGVAGSVYAGSGANNQKNTASVSQYDVACYRGGH